MEQGTMPSFPAGTRREEVAQVRREMMEEYFKPEGTETKVWDNDAAIAFNKATKRKDQIDREFERVKRAFTDPVNHPAHYKAYPVEVIDIIRHVLGPEGFRAYCIGNELKYRLRAGDKGDAAQDFAKAMKYREFREGK